MFFPRKANWEYLTSKSLGFSVDLAGFASGTFYFGPVGGSDTLEDYIEVDFAEFGLSLGPDSWYGSVSLSTVNMPSSGTLYLGPGVSSLSMNDFSGPGRVEGAEVAGLVGHYFTVIYFGLSGPFHYKAVLFAHGREYGVAAGGAIYTPDFRVMTCMDRLDREHPYVPPDIYSTRDGVSFYTGLDNL